MDISFASGSLQKVCNSQKEMHRKFGQKVAGRLAQRLSELKAAESLAEISHLPPARLHELGHDRQGQFAVDLAQPKRLIFKPDHNPVPLKADGGLDKEKITRLRIVEILDYH